MSLRPRATCSPSSISTAVCSSRPKNRLPSGPVVRFHGFGPAGPLLAEVPEDAFWGRAEHPLTPVIAATQDVITAISLVSGGDEAD